MEVSASSSLTLPLHSSPSPSESSPSVWYLLFLYANPFTSISFLCGRPPAKYFEERQRITRTIFPFVGILRFTNTILWILLIYYYFHQINQQFYHVSCDHNIHYCSKDYYYDHTCHIDDTHPCTISQSYVTVSILIFLSLSQCMVFFIKDRGVNGTPVDDDYVESPYTKSFSYLGPFTPMYLLLLFSLEAISLPFGTKEGEIAFVKMDTYSLEYTVIIFLSLLTWGIILTIYQSFYEFLSGWDFVTFFLFAVPYTLALLALILHCGVVVVLNFIDHHRFYTANIFFFSLQGEFILYKSLRTMFSSLSIFETVLTWLCIRIDNGDRSWWRWKNGERIREDNLSLRLCCATLLDWPTLIPTPDDDTD
jgi:hypothetical protein